jgi:hypothetical protein
LDVGVVFEHFLVVAAALLGRPAFNVLTHEFVQSVFSLVFSCLLDHLSIFLDEQEIFCVFLDGPY